MSPFWSKTLGACLALALLPLSGCSHTPGRGTPAASAEPAALPAVYEQALHLMRDGEYAAAIAPLRALSASHPDMAGPYVNLGIAYGRTGQAEAALQALEQALTLNQDNAAAQLQRGILYREQGHFQAALEAYQQALKLRPDYALAHRNLGILYDLYLQQPTLALRHYKRYLALAGDDDKTVSGWVIDLERRAGAATASVTP